MLALLLSGCALAGTSLAREPDPNVPLSREMGLFLREFRAVQESLRSVHPRFTERWLKTHGYDPADFLPRPWTEPESTGLRLVGKWGRGRSVEVAGQDSLVYLSLGSEVAVLDFADPAHPRLLTELQLGFCPTQIHVRDSLLVAGGWTCIETWNTGNPAQPVFQGRIPKAVADFCVRDTFLYFVSGGSFRVYSLADPASPYQLGACADSGWATTVAGNTVVLVLHDGFGFVDVSDPSAPRRVGFYGGNSIAAAARGTICCISNDEGGVPATASFEVVDIADPAQPRRLSRLTASGGYDIYLRDTLAFISGWQQPYGEFCIVDISDSTAPVRRGTCVTPGSEFGVWASSMTPTAFIASDERGMEVLNVTNPGQPRLDTSLLRADMARDIYLDGTRAYVAGSRAGLRVLDVADPSAPVELGGYDTLDNDHYSAAAADSFAFLSSMQPPYLRSIDVSDPTHPLMAGGGAAQTVPQDMVLRDTLLYLAGRLRFNIVNVARPRQPVLVGSCNAGDLNEAGLCIRDTLAYFAGPFSGLQVFSIADPASPRLVTTLGGLRAWGCDVADTLLYVGGFDNFLRIWSVADVMHAYELGAVQVPGSGADVKVRGRYAYVATANLAIVDVLDPRSPALVGTTATPDEVWAIEFDSSHVYAACFLGGVVVLDTLAVGLAEHGGCTRPQDVRLRCPLVSGEAVVEFAGQHERDFHIRVLDAMGRAVPSSVTATGTGPRAIRVAMRALPRGVYFIRIGRGDPIRQFRVVKF